jgi:hypothetical protein
LKKLSTLFFILLSVRGFAQQTADSSYFYQQSLENLAISQQNTTFLIANPIQKIGLTKLFYSNSQGGFRLAQQAQQTTNAGVYTEGINKFNRFTTSGSFSFKRTWQDSLAWSTKGLEQDDQPYYYGSIKAGAFERLNYSLNGILTYNLIKNKLYIGSGISYEYNSSTRSVDPRPEVDTYKLILSPELVYHFGSHFIGLNPKWGYGRETTGIGFKNPDFKNSVTGYPDRVNYLIQGYGLITNNQGVTNPLRRSDKYFSIGINYSGNFGNLQLKSAVSYFNQQEDNYQDFPDSPIKVYISYYDTDWITAFAQLNKINENHTQQLSINYSNQNGNDINIIFYAVNYRYMQDQLNVKYFLRLNTKQKFSPEFGVVSNYRKVEKSDYSTAHYINYSKLETSLLVNAYLNFNKNDKLALGIEVGYNKPISNSIDIPAAQQTVFTKGVVFPDYTYNTSSALKLSAHTNFITSSIFKQFRTGISLNGAYYNKLESKYTFTNATHGVGKQFVELGLTFNLYF